METSKSACLRSVGPIPPSNATVESAIQRNMEIATCSCAVVDHASFYDESQASSEPHLSPQSGIEEDAEQRALAKRSQMKSDSILDQSRQVNANSRLYSFPSSAVAVFGTHRLVRWLIDIKPTAVRKQ